MLKTAWRRQFRHWGEHALPVNYVVLDIETIGPGNESLITEIGYVIVHGTRIAKQGAWVLDWSLPAYAEWVPKDWLIEAFRQMEAVMGRPLNVDFTRMQQVGKDPRKVLTAASKLMQDVRRHRLPVVGHNVRTFDIRTINRHREEWLQEEPIRFDGALDVLDTGQLFRAVSAKPVVLPEQHDSLRTFLRRVMSAKTGKWNLGHCLETRGLMAGLDRSKLHGAEYDCYCTHLLFESIRNDL